VIKERIGGGSRKNQAS